MQPTHSSRRILLPVKPWFILFTLLTAMTLNAVPLGRFPGFPDWIALTLAFWCVREPLRVGMLTAFIVGIVMDVIGGAVMGQHALAYVLLAYFAGQLSRRVLWFGLLQQSLHILPLLLLSQVAMLITRLMAGAAFPGWWYFAGCFLAAMLWTPLNYLLLLPQFRPVERDDNRPI
ncbi:MAG: rod shape-determining protein MreD [Candidatus Methylophosphatis roskildensis]|jgi:rod shape-determining protein MreD|uniref:Rod shape-determining protein MreD n=1 Tax=Candidatus Methylophosphatis roskildensis TaxID=2899263 RepID=A0A9D7HKV0_9PROT|nr:rod shape-determining protein MreD [Candidatus Methylophosphatis roskildensis]MBK7235183.1 rod shape-determining protein MreD [Sterolibacteriaceae bacterium]MBK7662873.1 rod shape-determining protein MreD [Sterolibacteriaceae bacterium]MBK9086985.1 rod shape-determining protein MreD [Sterolibacteriaceae bacterium]